MNAWCTGCGTDLVKGYCPNEECPSLKPRTMVTVGYGSTGYSRMANIHFAERDLIAVELSKDEADLLNGKTEGLSLSQVLRKLAKLMERIERQAKK